MEYIQSQNQERQHDTGAQNSIRKLSLPACLLSSLVSLLFSCVLHQLDFPSHPVLHPPNQLSPVPCVYPAPRQFGLYLSPDIS